MSDHALVMGLHTEMDKLIAELEKVCFDPVATEDATLRARIRRQQLMDVRDYLTRKRAVL